MSRPRLALVYDVAYPFVEGGGERRMYEVASRLAVNGWDVHWYSLKVWSGDDVQKLNGITYHGLHGYAQLSAKDGTRSRREALSFGRAVLFCNADFSSFDIVWCGQWPYFHVLALMARLVPWRTHLLFDWWEVWGREWFQFGAISGTVGWLLETVLAKVISRIGHLVTISTLGKKQLLALGANYRRITYIPNGVNIEPFDAAEAASGESDIASFGRLKSHKNIDHLIKALEILKNRGMPLHADIVGDGPERRRLEEMACDFGVDKQTTFHGRVDDKTLMAILKRNKVFVHPSTKEGGGSITLLEANACGLPIVSYRHPHGIDPALIDQGKTGLIVEPINPEALADGIVEMLNLSRETPVRDQCRQLAHQFDWTSIAFQYEAFIHTLLCSTSSDKTARAPNNTETNIDAAGR